MLLRQKCAPWSSCTVCPEHRRAAENDGVKGKGVLGFNWELHYVQKMQIVQIEYL